MPSQTSQHILIVGGSGRVGLPLSLFFHFKGHEVSILDPATEKNSLIRNNIMPFQEFGVENWLSLAHNSPRFHIFEDIKEISKCKFDVAVIVVGTELANDGIPTHFGIPSLARSIIDSLVPGAMLILRSTVTPGTTEELEKSLSVWGRPDIQVVFAPERIAEGMAYTELPSLPQIIGATTASSRNLASSFFENLGIKILNLTAIEAEYAKLFSNAFRFLNFSISTFFYLIAENRGLDYSKIITAMRHEYPRLDSMPKSGYAGGPCLIKDATILDSVNDPMVSMLKSSLKIYRQLIDFVIGRIESSCLSLENPHIGIVGIGFKAGSDDLRESFALHVIEQLNSRGWRVSYFDRYAKTSKASFLPLEEILVNCDFIVRGNLDDEYAGLKSRGLFLDIWV